METVITIDQEHKGLQVSLCNSKKYHVFLYCEDQEADRSFARGLLDKLEKKGIKCCYSHRDFSPARTQIGSISEAIDQSLKTVLIFSKSLFAGREGSYTAEMHLQTYLDCDSDLFIPIKIDQCVVPQPFNGVLPTINILTVEEKEWFPNLIRSLADKTDNYLNMRVLAKHRGCYSPKERKKLDMKVKFLQQLLKHGLILEEKIFNKMIADIMTMYRDYRRPDKLFCPVLAYLFAILIAGVIFLYTTNYFQADLLGRWLPMFIIFFAGFMFAVIMSLVLKMNCQDCYHRSYKTDLAIINDKLIDENIIVTVIEDELHIVYYNYQPCLMYLREHCPHVGLLAKKLVCEILQNIYYDIKVWCCNPLEPFQNEDPLRQLLIKESAMYACWYLRDKLAKRNEERHTVSNQCLCQYIQDKYNCNVTRL